jgi:hypothetical protein
MFIPIRSGYESYLGDVPLFQTPKDNRIKGLSGVCLVVLHQKNKSAMPALGGFGR